MPNSTTSSGFTTIQILNLNGGKLRATDSLNVLSGTFQACHLHGTVTVGGSESRYFAK